MKKFLCAVLLVAAMSAHALDWKVQSFLVYPSVTLSNACNATNLLSPAYAASYNTNMYNMVITNRAGSRVIVGVTTNFDGTYPLQSANLFVDIPVSPLTVPVITSTTNNIPSTIPWQGNLAINASFFGGAAANSAVTFRFVPLYDGVHPTTVTTDALLWSITANGTTRVTQSTNIQLSTVFNNCKAIRCEYVNNADTDATGTVVLDTLNLVQIWP